MKKLPAIKFILLAISISLTFYGISGCKKIKNPIKYALGTFPDTVINIAGLNTQYDDYNSTCYILESSTPIIFSSNRGSSGGQFDLVQGKIWYQFNQTTGAFDLRGEMINDPFFTALLSKADTPGDDLGPYDVFSSSDGFGYLLLASQKSGGPLDLYYMKYIPYFGNSIPEIVGPYPVKILNSSAEDAYISFDFNQDSVYFTSNRGGDFDIFTEKINAGLLLDTWFSQDFVTSNKVDSINTIYDDKCPFVFKNIMVFTSNRPGGLGGFDLYYSLFKNGKWNSPVNFGPGINSSDDEYRPLLEYLPDFTNNFLIYSSNRPGGKGGYDLYFAGVTFDN